MSQCSNNLTPELEFLNTQNTVADFPNTIGRNDTATISEPVISFKIYDSCRFQDCCSGRSLGRVRVAKTTTIGNITFNAGSVLAVPPSISGVSVEDLIVIDTVIVSKRPSPFRNGYWDVDLKYVFEFKVVFTECDGTVIGCVLCTSCYNKKVNLFGSTAVDLALTTDLIHTERSIIQGEPFVLIESKAVALSAEVKYHVHKHRSCEEIEPGELDIVIGLFSIVKLFRIVDLLTESKGFYIPKEAKTCYPIDPCEFFDGLDFPMDIFSPPQKNEFMNGISSNIPNSRQRRSIDDYETRNSCSCDCNRNDRNDRIDNDSYEYFDPCDYYDGGHHNNHHGNHHQGYRPTTFGSDC